MQPLLNKNKFSLEDHNIVGYHGISNNTGMIHEIGAYVGRPLKWAICLLRFIELLFHHLFQNIDRATMGPNSFCRLIRQKLMNCRNTARGKI